MSFGSREEGGSQWVKGGGECELEMGSGKELRGGGDGKAEWMGKGEGGRWGGKGG